MVEQQAPLRGDLGSIGRSQRLRQVVVGVEAGSYLGHVFLVLSLQHVSPVEPLRLLLIDDVGEVGLGHRINDLGDFLRVFTPHPHLDDFRFHRRRHLDIPHQVADGIVLGTQGRQARDARPTQRRRQHERALDELHLRLAVRFVFGVITTAAHAEHARLVADAKPGDRLEALGQKDPNENAGDRGECERQGRGR